jgi:hypothetical protein
MLLLGPTMQSLLHLSVGRELWDELRNSSGYGRIAREQCGNGNGARLGRCH